MSRDLFTSPSPAVRPSPFGASGAGLLGALALLAGCFAVYGQTLGFGFINLDDPGYVFENANVRAGLSWAGFRWAWTTFTESNWHPLTWLSLMADAQLYGANAGGFHLTNVLLHAANSTLLFAWLRRATGAFRPALATAFFFAVHPLHVESVAWISERKDVLSVFLGLLTLLAYTRYAQRGGRTPYALSLALFALGLTAKPMLVTLPALLLLLDYWPLRRAGRLVLLEKAPFLLLAAVSSLVTLQAQHAGHAVVPFGALSIEERAANAVTAAAAYVVATFWPVNLGVYYPYWPQRPWVQPAASAILLAAGTAGAWVGRRRAPYAVVGWAWFLVSLAPVIGVVQVGGQAMADRYTYLPHIGLFIALAWSAEAVWRPWLAGAVALAALACTGLGMRQAAYWRDGATLFAHTFQITRHSSNLCILYGDACLAAARYPEAEGAFREGLRAHPSDPLIFDKLGYTRLRQERWADALAALREADRLRPGDPGTLFNLGRSLDRLGRREEAIDVFRRGLRIRPDLEVQMALADALLGIGQPAEARASYEAVLTAEPKYLSALTRLAWLLSVGDPADPAQALSLARRAVALTHGADVDSLDALASALGASGQWAQAVGAATASLQTAQRASASEKLLAIRRERIVLYRTGQLPRR